jgi:hypothetical protein
MSAGGVKCWGLNSGGELGIGSTVDQWRPVDVNLGPGTSARLRAQAGGGDGGRAWVALVTALCMSKD